MMSQVANKLVASVGVVLMLATACSTDPEKQAKNYLDAGEKYFKNGKFKEASIMYRRALQKNMRFGEAYYRLGLSELKLGRFVEALRSLQRAVELQPNNMDAPVKLAEMFLLIYANDPRKPQQFIKEIEDLTKRLMDKNPNSYDGLRLSGYLALTKQKASDALQFFEQANKVKPNQPDLVHVLVQTLGANGRWEDAEKMAKDMLAREKTHAALYDVLYSYYMREKRVDEAETILKQKSANNPSNAGFILQNAAHYYLQKRPDEMASTLDRLLKDSKTFPKGRLQVGEFYFRIRNYDKAVEQYEAGIKAVPADKLTYQKRIVETLVMQGKKTEASQLVEAILKEDSKDNEAIAMRAALMLQAGTRDQVQQAVNDLQSVVTRQPENAVLRFNLARALMAKGDLDAARVQLIEALKHRADYTLARLALAQVYVAKADFANASQTAGQILQTEPNNVAARLMKTSAMIGLREFDQAKGELKSLLSQNASLSDAQFQLGMINLMQRDFAGAQTVFRDFRKSNPTDPRALSGLVETLVLQNQIDGALALLSEESAKAPDRADVRTLLANTARRGGKFDIAEREYRALLEKSPKSAELLVSLGIVQRERGDLEGAKASFQRAKVLVPADVSPWVQEALVYEKAGKLAEAMPVYQEILKRDPDNPVALNNAAFLMAESGSKLDEALSMANKARQKLPNNPDVADTLGWIYIKKNLSDSAIQIFQELITKNPEKATYHYHLAMALFQKGDKPGAKKSCETALARRPDKDEEARIKELLAKCG
jgi:tetratricopeptide (TPR) repeat protein